MITLLHNLLVGSRNLAARFSVMRFSVLTSTCASARRPVMARGVFDITIEAEFNGHRLPFSDSLRDSSQTRTALAPGERGAFIGTLHHSPGFSKNPPVTLRYRASSTGNPRALDVPQPKVQYIEREDHSSQVVYSAEVRNVEGRPWSAIDPGLLSYVPCDCPRRAMMIALYRGRIAYWTDNVLRWPAGEIPADGRAWYRYALPTYTPSDEVHFFPREVFRTDSSTPAHVRWELRGLDTWVESEEIYPDYWRSFMWFQATLVNPSNVTLHGEVYVVPRRSDFHAIGGVQCVLGVVDPGGHHVCRGRMMLSPGHTPDDVKFTTVELGIPTACQRTAAATGPIPPPATLPNIVGRAWLPWVGVQKLAVCP